MAITKDVVAIVGKYTDKSGSEKNQYMTIGKIIETKNGQMLKIDAIPVQIWAYLNDPKERDNKQDSKQSTNTTSNYTNEAPPLPNDDDIPF